MSHLSDEELTNLAARERSRAQLPLTNWESLSAQLRDEGIIRDSVVAGITGNGWWLRAAAAVLLVAGGAAAGRFTASTRAETVASKTEASKTETGQQAATPVTNVSLASQTTDSVVPFKSDEEAWDVLNRAGGDYQRASAYLATRDASGPKDSTSVFQARLAALDGMASASRKALYAAPHDPVINQYYLAAEGARKATMQQLSTSLPSGMKLVKW